MTISNVDTMSDINEETEQLVIMFDATVRQRPLIAALIKNNYIVELLVDNKNLTVEDIDRFYAIHNLVREPHPDITLRKYR